MSRFLVTVLSGVALLMLTPLEASAQGVAKPYVVLDKSLSQLRADFNVNVGKVRMLYIVGPTCGICLRGLSDLDDTLYSKKADDPRLATFVVHVPTLGAREKNVGPASHLITDRHTSQYWEETGIVGRLMQQTMGMNQYVWDFWMIYGPEAVWSDDRPPVPDFWQHQLGGLPAEKRLDATVFAAKVDEFLTKLPAVPTSGAARAAGKSD
jgi:hypothetical protein